MAGIYRNKIKSLWAILKLHALPVSLFIILFIKLAVNLNLLPADILNPPASNPAPCREEDKQTPKYVQQRRSLIDLLGVYKVPLDIQDKSQLAELILEECRKNELDPRLILALIFAESRFYTGARSSKDARGLMQLLHPTAQALAQEIGLQNYKFRAHLHDPYLNLRLGIYYLAQLIRRFDNLELALVAYNIGPSRLDQILSSRENVPTGFSRKVMKHYQQAKQKHPLYFLD